MNASLVCWDNIPYGGKGIKVQKNIPYGGYGHISENIVTEYPSLY